QQQQQPAPQLNLGNNSTGYGAYRNKQQINGSPQSGQQNLQQQQPTQQQSQGATIKLENGLMFRDQYIIASPDLKNLYMKTIKYFQDPKITADILSKLNNLLMNPVIVKLITFIKNLNNLTFNHKILCLVINKNGKFDLLSYPHNSNIFLQKNDLVIVDGDRGKDLVMIVEPLVNLNFAILFNFLKKLEHLKSLTIIEGQVTKTHGGTHPTTMNASTIINSHLNEDNEFIITLPTKQVLRFANPKEVHKISGKFLEEKKAFITCYNKIKELNLESDLSLINVEYQCDFKKLIFYYFAGFKRIDFRGLIKELFKIYKTRIWLCAVLPYDKAELYITMGDEDVEPKASKVDENAVPSEYELTNDQILNFSINEFDNLATPNYFHLINVQNLIKHLSNEIKGNFYGFNTGKTDNNLHPIKSVDSSDRSRILPSFNPFGDI
ncbi:MAG: PSP1 domain-containing protein, partial [Asgard group archaeon]|nr:PSP1 domain-containing protein [Asgard group archaeon]